MVAGDKRLERWEGRLERLSEAVPYALLVLSAGFTWLVGDHTAPGGGPVTLGLVVLAAVWTFTMVTLGGDEAARTRRALYVAGLIVLIAVLNGRAIWFATFFAFVGYLHSWRYLSGVWRFVGVAATAAVSVPHYLADPPDPARPGPPRSSPICCSSARSPRWSGCSASSARSPPRAAPSANA